MPLTSEAWPCLRAAHGSTSRWRLQLEATPQEDLAEEAGYSYCHKQDAISDIWHYCWARISNLSAVAHKDPFRADYKSNIHGSKFKLVPKVCRHYDISSKYLGCRLVPQEEEQR